jgi:hypothetical protein
VMAVMMVMAAQPRVMRNLIIPLSLRCIGWVAVAVMTLSVAAMAVMVLM